MREVIVVSRSKKTARKRVSRVLDAYFWRIGDQTWRGKATNACLDRVSRDLRKSASRHTAVSIQEVRSSSESRTPLIRIGSSRAFSDDGKSPISSNPSVLAKANLPPQLISGRSIVQLAALFHDLGKATKLFQSKLHKSMKSRKGVSDAIRHELFSAYVWDDLFGNMDDLSLLGRLPKLTASEIDISTKNVVTRIMQAHDVASRAAGKGDSKSIDLKFPLAGADGSITQAVGLLILSHHRLPGASSNLKRLSGETHIRGDLPLSRSDLEIAPGQPFWHENWFQNQISKIASVLKEDACREVGSIDICLRASLMLGDHMGSARKVQQDEAPEHMANTLEGSYADSLSMHTQRVCNAATRAFNMLNTQQHSFPSLLESQVPLGIRQPSNKNKRFVWQANAVEKAKELASSNEGGFFACLLAGTGTGKTRGAPAILAAASLHDTDPAKRYLRFTLGLGLRVLAKQSADEYVNDLGFSDKDVSVVVGQKPLDFGHKQSEDEVFYDGSESQINLPEWLRVEMATGGVPLDGDEGEEEWIRSLTIDTSRRLPAFCDRVLMNAGKKQSSGRRLIEPPVMICTIDNMMSIASPNRSSYLIPMIRMVTSDLILDEIDQYGPEDIAAVSRLVFQTAAAGRRVVIMSATVTKGIAKTLHDSYKAGWSMHAKATGVADHVNFLCTGDGPGSCVTSSDFADSKGVIEACIATVLSDTALRDILRKAEILKPVDGWAELVPQIDASCSALHDLNAVEMSGYKVSFGMVRATRIAHTAALAIQIPAGDLGEIRDRLRVKICLHSNMPRITRSWIEDRLRRALNRKGQESDKGVFGLCLSEDIFNRADMIGTKDIEIVLVTSPVVETGNDLDFDWAILDPVSTRSVIQSAGRVRRHRAANGITNIHILGRPLVAMQDGKIAMPGVETDPSKKSTGVMGQNLDAFEGRHFRDLVGHDLIKIDSSLMLDLSVPVPLRDAEARLCTDMISINLDGPSKTYLGSLVARMNQQVSIMRKFRRSTSRDLLFTLAGEGYDHAEWHVDVAPGRRESELNTALPDQLLISDAHIEGVAFCGDVARRAWDEYLQANGEHHASQLSSLFEIRVADYGNGSEGGIFPQLTLNWFTGVTRGLMKDLSSPFGKALKK